MKDYCIKKNIWLLLIVSLLAGCAGVGNKNGAINQMALQVSAIPKDWQEEPIVYLQDSTELFYEDTVLQQRNIIWMYVQKTHPRIFEYIRVTDYETVENPPKVNVTAYDLDGRHKEVYIGRRYKTQLEEGVSNEWSQTATVPQYQKGKLIRYEVVRDYIRPEFESIFFFRGSYPVLNKHISLKVPNGIQLNWGLENEENLVIQDSILKRDDHVFYHYHSHKVNKIFEYSSIPEHWYAGVHVSFSPHYGSSKNWEELGDHYLFLIQENTKVSSEIKKVAQQIQSEDFSDIVQEAFGWVRHKIRYYANSERIHAIVPRSLDDVIQNGYGDCKEMSYLLQAILKEKGIQANLVLIATYAKNMQLRKKYPSMAHFDHVVLAVKNKEKEVFFLDPTMPVGNPMLSASNLHGRKAFVLEKGSSYIDTIKVYKTPLRSVKTKNKVYKTALNKWEMKGVVYLRGLAAYDLFYALQYQSKQEETQYLKSVLESLFELSPISAEIKLNTDSLMVLEYTQDVSGSYLNMDKGGFKLNTPSLYGGRSRYTTISGEGPLKITDFSQEDTWEFSEVFSSLEKTNIENNMLKGEWKKKGPLVERHFVANEKYILDSERKTKLKKYHKKNKFMRAVLWN